MATFEQAISEQIWKLKYQYKGLHGEIYDKSVEDTWSRVATALASCEAEDVREYWEKRFYHTLEDYKFMPAGRIVSGAGTGRNVTLMNCFVMGNIPDDMKAIFDNLTEAALTMQQGGGIGYCFSSLRPKGADVIGVGSDASGPLSFMDVWDAMCRTIKSAGSRRGAMMATMHCWHPDIMDFITAKRDPNRLRMFNMSVLITDDFMEAVKNDADWDLHFNGKVYKTIKAKTLWDAIMMATYSYAEPGIIFIDRINKDNNLRYLEEIVATNPCGEQPLPPYGSCLLGSLNLARFVLNPFTDKAVIDYISLIDTINCAIRMMDNVNDVTKFPLEKQAQSAAEKRRIGLGVTGLADMLIMRNMTYGSEESVKATDKLMDFIAEVSYNQSVDLAIEKGQFPAFDAEKYLASGFMQSRTENIRKRIAKHGIRNALLTSIAPTGTISIYAGNVSSGIEPVFAMKYEREIINNDGSTRTEIVKDYAVYLYEKLFPNKPLTKHFVTAQTLTPKDHIAIQSAAQKHIDSSISKTINCPEDISFGDFKEVYMMAWDKGCKGCTTYRPNDVTGSVLTSLDNAPEPEENGACELRFDENTGQLIRSCE